MAKLSGRIATLELKANTVYPPIPAALGSYSQTNENQARVIVTKALNSLNVRLVALESGAVVAPPPPPPPPPPVNAPIVTTSAATGIGTGVAVLHGTVNPNNANTTYHFDYGTTTAYGSSSPTLSLTASTTVTPVSASLSGLASSTLYHFRLTATNSAGTSVSSDGTFTTSAVSTVTKRTTVGLFSLGGIPFPNANWGNSPFPDTCFSSSSGGSYVGSGTNYIGSIRAIAGLGLTPRARMIIKVTGGSSDSVSNGEGGNPLVDGPLGTFSVAIWKQKYDAWYGGLSGTPADLAEFRSAVGVEVAALLAADDYGSARSGPDANGYVVPITFEQLEEISEYSKRFFPTLPVVGRVNNTTHRTRAAAAATGNLAFSNDSSRRNGIRQFKYFDAGWGQFKWRTTGSEGFPDTYARDQIQAGDDCGLGLVGGANILNQGSGTGGSFSINVSGTAGVGATSIPCDALAAGLEKGKVLTFTGGKSATVAATAFRRATSISVSPLAAGLVAGDVAPVTLPGCIEAGCSAGQCGMSRAEIEEIGLTWATYVHPAGLHYPRAGKAAGIMFWAFQANETCGSSYVEGAGITASLQVVYDGTVGRQEGNYNIRGDVGF